MNIQPRWVIIMKNGGQKTRDTVPLIKMYMLSVEKLEEFSTKMFVLNQHFEQGSFEFLYLNQNY